MELLLSGLNKLLTGPEVDVTHSGDSLASFWLASPCGLELYSL
jgi:hypothetical protein